MPLIAALISWVGPIVSRILIALGFSVVTIGGMTQVVSQLKSMATGYGNSMLPDVLNLFQISGGAAGLAIVMGAINTRVALWVVTQSVRILGKSS
jgi:hypothetical protein